MPRKYRPPATKRRKNRTTNIPYAPAPESAGEAPDAADAAPEAAEPLVAVDVMEAPPEPEDRPLARPQRTAGARHVTRDYSYVRGEVLRIVVTASIIVAALVIISIIRG